MPEQVEPCLGDGVAGFARKIWFRGEVQGLGQGGWSRV